MSSNPTTTGPASFSSTPPSATRLATASISFEATASTTRTCAGPGSRAAKAAIICPKDGSDDADMHSILIVLAIESLAPDVRTVVEVNNPKHVPHFKRADVDEVLVTSKLASRLLARTALHPGLGDLVTDMVSGGVGSELYRVPMPDWMIGRPVLEVSANLLEHHGATLLAVARNGELLANPGSQVRAGGRRRDRRDGRVDPGVGVFGTSRAGLTKLIVCG